MSEYIVSGAELNNTVLKSITPNGYEHESWLPVREEIVRCRDCKHFMRGNLCNLQDECNELHWLDVEPDGFCAWAVKRTGAENG